MPSHRRRSKPAVYCAPEQRTPEHRAKHATTTAVIYELVPGTTRNEARTAEVVIGDLDIMFNKGQITAAQLAIAKRFRNEFDLAHLDPLRAADLGRLPGGKASNTSERIQRAKDFVWECLQTVGGASSQPGIALWYLVGAGHSQRETARRIAPWATAPYAAGLAVAALNVLAPSD
ncbi:hypothetical protein FNB15_18255 [Ferrovibrio terrae]|uniref:Uncharacterized protein n=1 Tax=Ferrovibrio terrae TaxID=2594003 RepID=A0A516H5R4_9PROT|nr:hypothetical protein [Ferrovibrio terrae]QDO99092.1 hypothetical protein FNB15_18255 [Ferrovibrio terrae]